MAARKVSPKGNPETEMLSKGDPKPGPGKMRETK
jgi:hypothetical protein